MASTFAFQNINAMPQSVQYDFKVGGVRTVLRGYL